MSLFRRIGRGLFGRVLPRTAYPVVTGPLKNSWFILGSLAGEGGGASVYFNMVEREQTAAMIREIKPGEVFFDIGANVGYYTVLASRLVGEGGKVVACEPLIRNISFLERHVEMNQIKNVLIMAFACSNNNSVASFSPGTNTATGHLSTNIGSANTPVLVPTITLDSLAEQMNLRPDVIKIDVEGAELAVLNGAKNILSNDRPRLFLSTHSDDLRSSCIAYLRQSGYEVSSLIDNADSHEFLAVSAP